MKNPKHINLVVVTVCFFILFCAPHVSDKSYCFINGVSVSGVDVGPNNRTLTDGGTLSGELAYYIHKSERGFRDWGLCVYWQKYDPEQGLIGPDDALYLYNIDDPCDWPNTYRHEFSVTCDGEEPFCGKNGEYIVFARLVREYVGDGNDPFDIRYWPCNIIDVKLSPCDGPHIIPSKFTGILAYCGDQRYGCSSEVLDYPLAYPITVQVFDNGVPIPDQQVEFTITWPSNVHYAWFTQNHLTTATCYTQNGLVIGDQNHSHNNCGCETIDGAASCPVEFGPGPSDSTTIRIEAEWINPYAHATQTKAEFRLMYFNIVDAVSGVHHEVDIPSVQNDRGFNERYHWGVIIPGDGLWGWWKEPVAPCDETLIDNDFEAKNIRLEIDWISDLGHIQLTFDDIEYICEQLSVKFEEIGISIDPVINISGSTTDPINCSVASQINANQSAYDNSLISSVIGNKDKRYFDDDLHRILQVTRGDDLVGQYGGVGQGEDIPHYVRRRIHLVILPGKYTTDSRNTLGNTHNANHSWSWDEPTASVYASGYDCFSINVQTTPPEDPLMQAFPWTNGPSATQVERPIDRYGCVIFAGAIPLLKDVHQDWIFYDPDGKRSRYCNMLVFLIAHELGHALGLDHESFEEEDIMFKEIDWTEYTTTYAKKVFVRVDQVDADQGRLINLRKVLGREMTTSMW